MMIKAIDINAIKFKNLDPNDFNLIYERTSGNSFRASYDILKNDLKLTGQALYDAIDKCNFGGKHMVYANSEQVTIYID